MILVGSVRSILYLRSYSTKTNVFFRQKHVTSLPIQNAPFDISVQLKCPDNVEQILNTLTLPLSWQFVSSLVTILTHWSSKQNSGELHCIVAISALLVMWYAVYYYSGHRKANAPQILLCMQELSTENYEYHTLTTMPQWLQFCLQQNFSVTHWMDEMMAWANRVWTQFRKWSKYHPKKSNRVVIIHQIFLSVIEKATKQNDSFHLFFWSINKNRCPTTI